MEWWLTRVSKVMGREEEQVYNLFYETPFEGGPCLHGQDRSHAEYSGILKRAHHIL